LSQNCSLDRRMALIVILITRHRTTILIFCGKLKLLEIMLHNQLYPQFNDQSYYSPQSPPLPRYSPGFEEKMLTSFEVIDQKLINISVRVVDDKEEEDEQIEPPIILDLFL
jgi:hypothetical protein